MRPGRPERAPDPGSAAEPRPDPRPPGTWRIGSIAGSPVYVSTSWLAIAALIAVAIAPHVADEQPGIGGFSYVVGVLVAVMLYLAILLHEASHVVVVKRFGHRVPSITLSFMGGRTTVDGEAATPREEFLAAVVGPIASLAVGGVCLAALAPLPPGVIRVVVEALAYTNLGLGALNLLPVLPLDGGRVLKALVWRLSGSAVSGTVAAAWAGRGLAGLLFAYGVVIAPLRGRPLGVLDLIIVGFLGMFLWAAAGAELSAARLRQRFADVVARDLARRTLAVPPDLPLAEAVRRAREAEAGAIVTVDGVGRPVGVVSEAALRALPAERHPWVSTSSVSRALGPATCLSWQITGSDLLTAISAEVAPEYLLLGPDGGIFGVLALSDVDRAVGLT